ncbi:hypothetical protein ACSAMZ_21585 (plasmid) [Xanthomonas citri pv. bilvae]
MRASEVLQKCLSNSLSGMHALRQRTLLGAVEALVHGGNPPTSSGRQKWS